MTLFVEKKSTSDHGVDYVVRSDDDYIAYQDQEPYSFEPNPSNDGAVQGATVSHRPAIYPRKYSAVFVSCVIISRNSHYCLSQLLHKGVLESLDCVFDSLLKGNLPKNVELSL